MSRVLIARMNVDKGAVDEFNSWYDGAHMKQANRIPGFGRHHRRYQALPFKGRYWNYKADPEYTAIYEVSESAKLERLIDSAEFAEWSGEFIERWRERTEDEVSIICDQVFGNITPIDYHLVLIAQMNVGSGYEDEFNRWYNEEHIPQAGKIPGFGNDHRRFRSVEAEGKHWQYKCSPRYTALYEIAPDADVMSTINSEQYRAWSGDFLARWRDRTSDEVSTICRRIY